MDILFYLGWMILFIICLIVPIYGMVLIASSRYMMMGMMVGGVFFSIAVKIVLFIFFGEA